MAAIINFAVNNTFLTVVVASGAFFICWIIYLQWQVWRLKKKVRTLFAGHKAMDLEGVIFEQIKRQRQTEKDLKNLDKFARYLEKMATKSVQKVGVVRFNPFKESGSDQSFSIALLDTTNSGVMISGLFTREGTRLYVKPLAGGESKYPLSNEEKQAIETAEKNWENKQNKTE
ncbi:MAG: hypothetical protein A2174_00640 [Candidatus Portnoybacteria bacterium RBG_13_41_18]|uniref:DUF4446 domain-containing protein n=1 Tax=Candidatus Portnoybacteria bacterium RBG_13_41_18 TaxID=1801991 RepID=A0A1G2F577_9BACT|nr:MAG: hypothetical protein A2174_00640 [Candidatus Portnoybacteria bacterium RBG_13_41_18]